LNECYVPGDEDEMKKLFRRRQRALDAIAIRFYGHPTHKLPRIKSK
jgi:hypothetical protein